MSNLISESAGSWEVLKCDGDIPKPIAHHSMFYCEEGFIVYGGIQNDTCNEEIFKFVASTQTWEKLEVLGETAPKARDDNASCLSEDGTSFIIFGGYVEGTKTNELWIIDLKEMTWKCLDEGTPTDEEHKALDTRPCRRVGAAIAQVSNKIYLFGGQDEDGEKPGDLWAFDLSSNAWTSVDH